MFILWSGGFIVTTDTAHASQPAVKGWYPGLKQELPWPWQTSPPGLLKNLADPQHNPSLGQ